MKQQLLWTLTCSALLSSPSLAQVENLTTLGSYADLPQAVAGAVDGDILTVAPGTYSAFEILNAMSPPS